MSIADDSDGGVW